MTSLQAPTVFERVLLQYLHLGFVAGSEWIQLSDNVLGKELLFSAPPGEKLQTVAIKKKGDLRASPLQVSAPSAEEIPEHVSIDTFHTAPLMKRKSKTLVLCLCGAVVRSRGLAH